MTGAVEYPDLVVVGAGLFGLTVAQQAVEHAGARVEIIDVRDHIGGNAYSYMDEETGAEIHKYGAHLFHTSNRRVWEYVNRFTSFTGYVHRRPRRRPWSRARPANWRARTRRTSTTRAFR